jgi:hypothetical protein
LQLADVRLQWLVARLVLVSQLLRRLQMTECELLFVVVMPSVWLMPLQKLVTRASALLVMFQVSLAAKHLFEMQLLRSAILTLSF